jgi:hypothetical protein
VHLEREQPALPGLESLAHRAAQASVIAEPCKVRRGCPHITRREETSVCADSLAVSTASSRYDWDPVSHRLGDGQPE